MWIYLGCYWNVTCQEKWWGDCGHGHVISGQSSDCKGLCSRPRFPLCPDPYYTRFYCCIHGQLLIYFYYHIYIIYTSLLIYDFVQSSFNSFLSQNNQKRINFGFHFCSSMCLRNALSNFSIFIQQNNCTTPTPTCQVSCSLEVFMMQSNDV